MSSVHQYSALHHLEESHDDDDDQVPHLIPFFPVYDPSPFTFSLHSPQRHPLIHHHHEDDDQSSPCGGSSDPLLFMVSLPTKEDHEDEKATARQQQHSCDARKNGTVKWMSSKMRLMKKMMNSDEEATRKPSRRSVQCPQDDQQPIGIVRVCSDCNTTKTPLWRSGPQGPKSLCNACGIRQRKARKAMALAAATANAAEVRSPPADHKAVTEEKCWDSGDDHHAIVPFKKRSKFSTAGATEAKRFEEAAMELGQNQHLPKVFPQDEKEAAILLMALSCGLVCR